MAAPASIEPSALPEGGFAIRRRIVALVVLQFVVLVGMFAVLGLWPDGSGTRVLVVLLLAFVTLSLPFALALLAAPIVSRVEALERQHADLLQLYGRARSDALLDGLTELGNHRAFQEELARQLVHAERLGTPLCLLVVDVDDLKRVNDRYGHSFGDELLARIAQTLASRTRRGDIIGRLGGDEFAVVLPGAGVHAAENLAHELENLMASTPIEGPDGPVIATASVGVAGTDGVRTGIVRLLARADVDMYRKKRRRKAGSSDD